MTREAALTKKRSRLLEEVILKSWWVLLFILLSFFAFDQTSYQRKKEIDRLQTKHDTLSQQKEKALAKQTELKLAVESQDDPRWMELILIEKLGLVPEGYTKVVFVEP